MEYKVIIRTKFEEDTLKTMFLLFLLHVCKQHTGNQFKQNGLSFCNVGF